jgi:minor extracellular serine protease Vpr
VKNMTSLGALSGRAVGWRAALSVVATTWLLIAPALGMDKVRVTTGVDTAVSQFGVTGRGVIVALLDRGIDWKNLDFRNADGTTRIAYIFDLTDDTGATAPGNTYGMGTIFTRAQINSALTGGPTLATRDAVGHGTTSSAIAAGSGRNSPGRKYRGVAYDATIIMVKVTSEGAPAHDGQPAEAPYYQPERLPVAIDFVRDKAHELGFPAVMLMNLGSPGGPTDGTSDLARKIDATVGSGIPGLVFVTGTGDAGGAPNRAAGNVTQGGSTPIQIQKGNGSVSLIMDLWYKDADRFNVMISGPFGTSGTFTSPATNGTQDFQQTSNFTYYQNGSAVTFYGDQTGKREVYVSLDGPAGTYTITLTGTMISAGGHFDAILNPSDISASYDTNKFLTNVAPGSLADASAAHNNICPDAFVNKTSWTDIDGNHQILTGQGNPGEIWTGSSIGPTADGRLGVDVSAPSTDLVTTYNPTSYWATNRGNLINDGGGLYGIAGAVSGASPTVTGIIALMLQANPSLDAVQVKQILQQSAKADSFTGAVPNTTWGYGKVDAVGAVSRAIETPCVAGVTNLCMTSSRFRVKVAWSVPSQGTSGVGQAIPLTGDTGYFWFFSSSNVELVIKVLDARGVNGNFWVFYGALSNVQYTIMVEDTQTGVVKSYVNPDQNLASFADTAAFSGANTPPGESAEAMPATAASPSAELDYARYAALTSASVSARPRAQVNARRESKSESISLLTACSPGSLTLCLNSSRFKIQVAWSVPSQGTSGAGMAVPLTGDTGYFWFFSSNNVELVIKVLDGTGLNGHFWVFYGALSNVQYTITVTDTHTSAVKIYNNPSGKMASVADTSAF